MVLIQMHIRHSTMLSSANYLQTLAEPKIVRCPVILSGFWGLMRYSSIDHGISGQTKKIGSTTKSKTRKLKSTRNLMSLTKSTSEGRVSEMPVIVRSITICLQNNCRLTRTNTAPVTPKTNGNSKAAPNVIDEDGDALPNHRITDEGDQVSAKSANNTAKPAEVPEYPTDVNTNTSPSKHKSLQTSEPLEGKMDEIEDDGEHVDGDEDAVIY